MSNIVLTLTAADHQFVQKMLQAKAEAEKLGYAVELLDKKGAKAGQTLGGMAQNVTRDLGKAALQFAGIGTVMAGITSLASQLRAELDHIQQRRSEAAGAYKNIENPQQAAYMSLGVGASMTPAQLDARIAKMAGATHEKRSTLYAAASQALSARGNLSIEQALRAVEIAAKAFRGADAEEISRVTGGIIDHITKHGGSPEEAFGYIGSLFRTARVVRTPDLARNIIPGAATLADAGASPAEAGGLLAYLTHESKDPTGERSRTAAQTFAEQLARATASVPELKDGSPEDRMEFIRGKSANARLLRWKMLGTMSPEFAQLTPAEKKSMDRRAERAGFGDVQALHGEAATLPGMRGLLEPTDHKSWQLYHDLKREIPTTPEAQRQAYDQSMKALAQSDAQRMGRIAGGLEAETESARLGRPVQATKGIVIEKIPDLLRALGQSSISAKVDSFIRQMGPDLTADQAMAEIDRILREEQIKAGTSFKSLFNMPRLPWSTELPDYPVEPTGEVGPLHNRSPEQRAKVRELQEIRKRMHQLRRELGEGAESAPRPAPAIAPEPTSQSRAGGAGMIQRVGMFAPMPTQAPDHRSRMPMYEPQQRHHFTLQVVDPFGRTIAQGYQRPPVARRLSNLG